MQLDMAALHNSPMQIVRTWRMPTIHEVLTRGVPALVPVHLPHASAEVRWVATSELADPTPYLEGGEILLTTGLGTAGWGRQWSSYVRRLAGSGVSALGLGTGLTHADVPEALVAACRRHDLNLFAVPREVTFVSVSRATARLLEGQERRAERDALGLQRALVQAAVRRSDPDDLVLELATALDGVACVLTRDGVPETGPFGHDPDRLDLDVVAAEVARLRPRGGRGTASVADRDSVTEVQPLGLRERPDHYLAVTVDGRMTSAYRTAVTTAVALLGLAIESRRSRRDTERALRTRAVELVVGDDPASARIVLAAVAGQPRVPEKVRVLRAGGDDDARQDALATVEESGVLAALVGVELVMASGDRLADELASRLADTGLTVGVGGLAPAGQASRSHEQAGHALADASTSVPLVRWDRLVSQGALSVLDPARAASFAESFLGPLETPELRRHDLVRTLQSFVRRHGSRARVADELGVHRNTVRSRVAQIEELIGASLDDPQTRASAWIALQLRDA